MFLWSMERGSKDTLPSHYLQRILLVVTSPENIPLFTSFYKSILNQGNDLFKGCVTINDIKDTLFNRLILSKNDPDIRTAFTNVKQVRFNDAQIPFHYHTNVAFYQHPETHGLTVILENSFTLFAEKYLSRTQAQLVYQTRKCHFRQLSELKLNSQVTNLHILTSRTGRAHNIPEGEAQMNIFGRIHASGLRRFEYRNDDCEGQLAWFTKALGQSLAVKNEFPSGAFDNIRCLNYNF